MVTTEVDVEEEPALSSDTLAILNDFLLERKKAEENADDDPFAEIWGMSQFWYDDATASSLANEVARAADGGRIACVACPSLFRKLRDQKAEQQTHLFEFDDRFAVLGNFTHYDYRNPLDVPEELCHAFAAVVIDPPYLSEECLEKSIQTMQALCRKEQPLFYALTGASMQHVARRLLDLRPVEWRPEHENKLGNEFYLYTTVTASAERLGGWQAKED